MKTEITLRPAALGHALQAVEVAPEEDWALVFSSGTRNGELILDPLPASPDRMLGLLSHLMAHGPEDRQIQLWSAHHPLFLERRGNELTARTSWPGPDSAEVPRPLTPEARGWVRPVGAKWDDEIVRVTTPAAGGLPRLSRVLVTSLRRMLGITSIECIYFFAR